MCFFWEHIFRSFRWGKKHAPTVPTFSDRMQLLFSESPFVDQFLQDVPLRDTLIEQETNGNGLFLGF